MQRKISYDLLYISNTSIELINDYSGRMELYLRRPFLIDLFTKLLNEF